MQNGDPRFEEIKELLNGKGLIGWLSNNRAANRDAAVWTMFGVLAAALFGIGFWSGGFPIVATRPLYVLLVLCLSGFVFVTIFRQEWPHRHDVGDRKESRVKGWLFNLSIVVILVSGGAASNIYWLHIESFGRRVLEYFF